MTVASDARLSPELAQKKKEAEEKRAAAEALLRRDFDLTFGTESGKRVLRWMMEQSGYQRSGIVADPANGDILPTSCIYNEALRIFYLRIRSKIKSEILIPVEHKGLAEDEVDIFS